MARALHGMVCFVTVWHYPADGAPQVLARPVTGRWHQIRKHLNGLSHPILNDAKHGDSKARASNPVRSYEHGRNGRLKRREIEGDIGRLAPVCLV